MAGKISAIREATTFTDDFRGVPIVLREYTSGIGAKVYGYGVFNLLAAGGEKADEARRQIEDADAGKTLREMATCLLVSPRIGEVTDDEADTLTIEEAVECGLAEWAVVKATSRNAEKRAEVEGFTKPSEDQAADSSPKPSEG